MSSFSSTATLLLATLLGSSSACVSHDSPNPIASQWPFDVSGNLNGTTMVIPVPIETAREVIPKEYTILESAYRALLPDFPQDMYPMMAVGVHDHDLRLPAYNLSLPDFSRTALEFPFLDLLGDGYTSFRWAATMMITAGSPAIEGSEGFGIKVYPAAFDPPCNAYEAASDGATRFSAIATNSSTQRSMALETWACHTPGPYTLAFLRNITNQPVFANPSICDNYKRLFNTSLTAPPNEPVVVQGTVKAQLEPFLHGQVWKDIFGWQLSTAFLEPPVGTHCADLQGYQGTGPGDSG